MPQPKKAKLAKPDPILLMKEEFSDLHAKLDNVLAQQKEVVKAHNSVANFINEVGKRAEEDIEKAKKKEKSFLSWFFGLQK